jgi:hypothetical protein
MAARGMLLGELMVGGVAMSVILKSVRAPLLALLLGPSSMALADPVEIDAEIVLAVDASGSMDPQEREFQRQGYAAALRHPDLMRAVTAGWHQKIALSYFEWAGDVRPATLIPWRLIDGPEAVEAFAVEIESVRMPTWRGTSISRAIDFAIDLLEGSEFAASTRIIDISGDGPNNFGPPVTAARDRAVEAGITINALPIIIRPARTVALDRYYEECVIGGQGAFVLVARAPEEFALAIRRKLILEVSGQAPEQLRLAADHEPMNCMVGEMQRRNMFDRF